jgi:hypothetical protein
MWALNLVVGVNARKIRDSNAEKWKEIECMQGVWLLGINIYPQLIFDLTNSRKLFCEQRNQCRFKYFS